LYNLLNFLIWSAGVKGKGKAYEFNTDKAFQEIFLFIVDTT
jgi:hypothetical protein